MTSPIQNNPVGAHQVHDVDAHHGTSHTVQQPPEQKDPQHLDHEVTGASVPAANTTVAAAEAAVQAVVAEAEKAPAVVQAVVAEAEKAPAVVQAVVAEAEKVLAAVEPVVQDAVAEVEKVPAAAVAVASAVAAAGSAVVKCPATSLLSSLYSGFSRARPMLTSAAVGTAGAGLVAAGGYVLVKEFPTIRAVIRNLGKATSAEPRPAAAQLWRSGVRIGLGVTSFVAGALALKTKLPFNRA